MAREIHDALVRYTWGVTKKDPSSSGAERAFGNASGAYPPSVDRLIREFKRLPGIGQRSAERLAFHVLKASKPEAMTMTSGRKARSAGATTRSKVVT